MEQDEQLTPAEIEAKRIMTDPEHPKHARWVAGDRAIRKEVELLFQQATGGK